MFLWMFSTAWITAMYTQRHSQAQECGLSTGGLRTMLVRVNFRSITTHEGGGWGEVTTSWITTGNNYQMWNFSWCSYECSQLLGSLLVGYVDTASFPGSGVWTVDCGGLGTMLVRVNLRSITAVIEGGWGALCVSSHVARGHHLSRASVL